MGQLPLLSSSGSGSGGNAPFPTTNLFLHWVFTNLGEGQVSDWKDVVQGWHMTNGVSAVTQPTNHTKFTWPGDFGLVFSPSSYLSATNVASANWVGLNVSMYMIYKIPRIPPGDSILFLQDDSLSETRMQNAAGVNIWRVCCFPTLDVSGPIGTNNINEVYSGLIGAAITTYTNGTFDTSGPLSPLHAGFVTFGPFFGDPQSYLYELAFFTNTDATASLNNQLHNYKVAIYGP